MWMVPLRASIARRIFLRDRATTRSSTSALATTSLALQTPSLERLESQFAGTNGFPRSRASWRFLARTSS
ncbi:hypothetical protein ATCV1_z170R [Acanthocystis turfacea chlorella virus 1]|uniref:Uncharacterized protein z170R n=1 Tax=Chlorovirus heliozoae TaxID=322019 RepID=A7K8D0_9PHYC|nr:hypothetical protein ATCV1_z170R [Acanthocystis turfacea chlorella virus 1]ABT16304.1 hypothetical protein ATCV1_z170R [Acanthocystis turfacea chlorella virus 1]